MGVHAPGIRCNPWRKNRRSPDGLDVKKKCANTGYQPEKRRTGGLIINRHENDEPTRRIVMKTSTMAIGVMSLLILAQGAWAAPLDSVVKIFTVQSSPYYPVPWIDLPSESAGSGCIINVTLTDLMAKVEANTEKYLTFEFDDGMVVALDTAQPKAAEERILKNYRIPSTKSADL
ncbi:MAG: hypothetical protein HY343_10910 [Lentisphaerae bacterium]|nr:hypothetical protein [Lentisphaerota bacterium]